MPSSAPFSFHCIICYEAFHADNRPPVVLPCGHTHVCATCSKRLKTCMECRTSLFITAPRSFSAPGGGKTQHHQHHPQTYRQSRYGGSPTKPRTRPAEKIPLPLPKNLVMISMMEAAAAEAERAGRDRRRDRQREAGGENSVRHEDRAGASGSGISVASSLSDEEAEKGYESGDDDLAVMIGMRSLSAPYGTYAVREREGLLVLRRHPYRVDEIVEIDQKMTPKDERETMPLLLDSTVTESTDSTQAISEEGSISRSDSQKEGTASSDGKDENEVGNDSNASGATGVKQPRHLGNQRTIDQPNQEAPNHSDGLEGRGKEKHSRGKRSKYSNEKVDEQEQQKEEKEKEDCEMDHCKEMHPKKCTEAKDEEEGNDQIQAEEQDQEEGCHHGDQQRKEQNREDERIWKDGVQEHGQVADQKHKEEKGELRGKEQKQNVHQDTEAETAKDETTEDEESKEPIRVEYGQTLQVVDFTDGLATLARGQGYIVASSTQLVKVGAPLDDACEIEGMLLMVAVRKKRYEDELAKVERLRSSLEDDLRTVLSGAKNGHLSIISPAPKPEGESGWHDKDEGEEKRNAPESPVAARKATFQPNGHTTLAPASPEPLSSPQTPYATDAYSPCTIDNSDIGARRGAPLSNAGIDDVLPRPGDVSLPHTLVRDRTFPGFISALGCPLAPHFGEDHDDVETLFGNHMSFDSAVEMGPGGAMIRSMRPRGNLSHNRSRVGMLTGSLSEAESVESVEVDWRDNRSSVVDGSVSGEQAAMRGSGTTAARPSAASSGAVLPPLPSDRHQHHQQHGQSGHHPSALLGAIDYRTGYSGHRGVGSLLYKLNHLSEHTRAERGEVRMMGEHRGIGSIGHLRRTSSHDMELNRNYSLPG